MIIDSMILARVACRLLGHKRGKRDNCAMSVNVGEQAFRCPRCGATWTRKERKSSRRIAATAEKAKESMERLS